MKILTEMRETMLGNLVTSILNNSIYDQWNQYIRFRDASGNVLCNVQFTSLDAASDGETAAYIFKNGEGNVLRGSATDLAVGNNPVTSFSINGITSTGLYPNMITGTVGFLRSSSDIQFNKVSWVEHTTISLTNLRLILY